MWARRVEVWLTGSSSALSRYTTKMAEEGGSPALLEMLSFLLRTWMRTTKMLEWERAGRLRNVCWVIQTCSSRSVLGSRDNHSSLKWTRPDSVSFRVNHCGESRCQSWICCTHWDWELLLTSSTTMDFFTIPRSKVVLQWAVDKEDKVKKNHSSWFMHKGSYKSSLNNRVRLHLSMKDDRWNTMIQVWTHEVACIMYLPRKSSWSGSLS